MDKRKIIRSLAHARVTHPIAMIAGIVYGITGGKRADIWQLNHLDQVEGTSEPTSSAPEHKTTISKMIHLEFRDNGTGYEDIVLLFNKREYIADSYYFVLDHEVPGNQDVTEIKRVIRLLLEQWLEIISNPKFETVYLPYAFYDQCTAWLKCEEQVHCHSAPGGIGTRGERSANHDKK